MSNMEIVTMAVSLTSLVVAAFAIYLSIQFFKMSSKVSEDTKEAANDIKASIRELDAIFRQQHKETFSMVRTTFDDLRKHAWPEKATEKDYSEIVEKKADEKFEEIRKEMSEKMKAEIAEISKKTKTDAQIEKLQTSMEKLLDETITESRHVEKDTELETLKNQILFGLFYLSRLKGKKTVSVISLHEFISKPPIDTFAGMLNTLEDENLISIFRTEKNVIWSSDEVFITDKGIKMAVEEWDRG